jgi:hypothetical protein
MPPVRLPAATEPLRMALWRRRESARAQAERLWRSRRGSFEFAGEDYRYHSAAYNTTWRNERTVEVPIALRFLLRNGGGRALEVGNVLGHYGAVGHDVLDKYERAPGVTNADVMDFEPSAGYGAVVAISTLEHVGFDEEPRDPDKAPRALERMTSWLAPGGALLVTLPLGYNAALDERLWSGELRFDELRCMRRVSADNRWRETTAAEVRGSRYGAPYPWANAIAFGLRSA